VGESAGAVIVDLKTCNDLDSFEYDARKFLYGMTVKSAQKNTLHEKNRRQVCAFFSEISEIIPYIPTFPA